jgi:hypothetical protein
MKPATKYVEDMIDLVDGAINELESIKESEENPSSHKHHLSTKADLSFKPNKNLGEGNASERNLAYRQDILTILKETVYLPIQKMLKKNLEPEEEIKFIDGCIEDYIDKGSAMIEKGLTKSYQQGVDEANKNMKEAAKKQKFVYKATTPDKKYLNQIIAIQKRTLEDKALVLRGRLRSAIDTDSWMQKYGSQK